MTEHFFGGECGVKEADHQSHLKTQLQPASFSSPSHYQQHSVIGSAAKQSVGI